MLRVFTQARRSQQCLIRAPRLQTRFQGPLVRIDFRQHRKFASIPTVLLPPVVFGGLVIALWTWKCFMMVVFQNKIIYMPGLPPNARGERIEDYKNQCGGIQWREERIKSTDGTQISLCISSVDSNINIKLSTPAKTVYILYFQGNASSLPPRLPFLSPVLRALQKATSGNHIHYVLVCCSYRGYWTSKGRASEKGIAMDAAAALQWIKRHSQASQNEEVPVIIWGQSIGAGVATNLAAEPSPSGIAIMALILETPFLSVRAMLKTLYPQKWLPYRYLWPFLWNHLDSWKALGLMREKPGTKAPYVLILEAGKDELVPFEHGELLEMRCRDLGLGVRKKAVRNALHTEVLVRQEGLLAVVEMIRDVAEGAHSMDETAESARDADRSSN